MRHARREIEAVAAFQSEVAAFDRKGQFAFEDPDAFVFRMTVARIARSRNIIPFERMITFLTQSGFGLGLRRWLWLIPDDDSHLLGFGHV